MSGPGRREENAPYIVIENICIKDQETKLRMIFKFTLKLPLPRLGWKVTFIPRPDFEDLDCIQHLKTCGPLPIGLNSCKLEFSYPSGYFLLDLSELSCLVLSVTTDGADSDCNVWPVVELVRVVFVVKNITREEEDSTSRRGFILPDPIITTFCDLRLG